MGHFTRSLSSRARAFWIALLGMLAVANAHAAPLADQPIGTIATVVPSNVMLALSVEFPTAESVAHFKPAAGDPNGLPFYNDNDTYVGIFDPYKCYEYVTTPPTPRFTPVRYTNGVTSGAKGGQHRCGGGAEWSGNFLNWVSTQTIDPFRVALTGGDRVVDTPSMTVLQKAFSGGRGSFPLMEVATSRGNTNSQTFTPFASTWLRARIRGLGHSMWIYPEYSDSSKRDPLEGTTPCDNCFFADPVTGKPAYAFLYDIRVEVCKSGNDIATGRPLREDNCVAYGSNYKPEGLMQKNADKMRFGIMSYLNDHTAPLDGRDGGVLRAAVKYVGPTQPALGGSPITNGNNEWDSNTGVFRQNPNPADATASGVSNSGVIPYLNQFGNFLNGAEAYKDHDPVSELYYATLRYFRKMSPVPEYQSGLTPTMKDGFPVLTGTPADPMQYSCQRNVVLGIGDTHTWPDRNLPGSSADGLPGKPAAVAADSALDAAADTNRIASFENAAPEDGYTVDSNLADAHALRFHSANPTSSYLVAGLAYWARTHDLRPDLPDDQPLSTYWVDVLEYGQFDHKNPYWLAAKYGGFDTDVDPLKPNGALTWRAAGRTYSDSNGTFNLPDNYFVANSPDAMLASLKDAFNAILTSKLNGSSASAGSSGGNLVAGNTQVGFVPSYNGKNWSGDLKAYQLQLNSSNVLQTTEKWSAQALLDTLVGNNGWNSQRRIVSGKWTSPATFQAINFRFNDLSTAQQTALGATGASASDVLNFLRGDRSKEGSGLRTRAHVLGDIVGSQPIYVQDGHPAMENVALPGYQTFRKTLTSRAPMVYVGANDGMLHAFNGAASGGNAGREEWAYVPSDLYEGPSGAPAVDGLAALSKPIFQHHYYVNASAQYSDVNFADEGDSSAQNWHTLLVSGLGKGGKSYVALDITAAGANSENAARGKVLWEFKDPRLGFTYGRPSFFRTRDLGWVVAVPSGYENSDGKGYVFLLRPSDGKLLRTFVTNEGSVADPLGLAHIAAYVPNNANYEADFIYGGDFKGNVWRFDVRPVPLANNALGDKYASTGGLPVTSEPFILSDPIGPGKRYVFIGTGTYLRNSEVMLNQQQRFFAFRDGSRYSAWKSPNALPQGLSDRPTGVNLPITAGQMTALTNLGTGLPSNTAPAGWYLNLTGGVAGANERIIDPPTAYINVANQLTVAFSSFMPLIDCKPDGSSNIYSIVVRDGKSNFTENYINLQGRVPGVAVAAESCSSCGISKRSPTYLLTQDGEFRTQATLPLLPNVNNADNLNWRPIWTQ